MVASVYHRRVSRRSPGVLVTAVLAWAGLCACAGSSDVVRREFEGEIHAVGNDALALALREIQYEERFVTLRLALHNPSEAPTLIERTGLLLAYGELELPPSSTVGPALPPSFSLAPGDTQELWIAYVTGDRMLHAGTLVVRAVRQGEAYTLPLQLAIPPAPVVHLDGAR